MKHFDIKKKIAIIAQNFTKDMFSTSGLRFKGTTCV